MFYNELLFIIIFLLFIIIYRSSNVIYRKVILLIFNSTFLIINDLFSFLLIIVLSIINRIYMLSTKYIAAIKITSLITAAINVIVLIFFKNTQLGAFIYSQKLTYFNSSLLLNRSIPYGISYYIFKSISLIIDFKRKIIGNITFVDCFNYLSYFPQLDSGPIQQSRDYFNNQKLAVKMENYTYYFIKYCWGVFKKRYTSD